MKTHLNKLPTPSRVNDEQIETEQQMNMQARVQESQGKITTKNAFEILGSMQTEELIVGKIVCDAGEGEQGTGNRMSRNCLTLEPWD